MTPPAPDFSRSVVPVGTTRKLHTIVAGVPYVVLVIFHACALHARLWLGNWPGPASSFPPGFSSPWFELYEAARVFSLFILGAAPLLWLCLLPFADREMTLRNYLPRLAVFLGGLGLVAFLVWSDPGGRVAWFLD